VQLRISPLYDQATPSELPPYFMAKAARLSGEEPDDEDYREFRAYMQGQKKLKENGVALFACYLMPNNDQS